MPHEKARWIAVSLSLILVGGLVGCPSPPPPVVPQATPTPRPQMGVLAGRVRQATNGQPVAGAMITVNPGGTKATVGADGRFQLDHLPVGQVSLTIAAPGFATAQQQVAIQDGEQLVDLMLGPAVATVQVAAISAITGALPDSPPTIGEIAVILGNGFGTSTGQVSIDGHPVTVRSWRDDRIEVGLDSPQLQPGYGDWLIHRSDGQDLRRTTKLAPLGGDPSPAPSPSAAAGQPEPTATDPPWHMRVLAADSPQDGHYASDFAAVGNGGTPNDWVDVLGDLDGHPSWLHPGKWYVQKHPDGPLTWALFQAETAPQPYFTMRRYAGHAFSTVDGALPNTYTISAKLQAGNSPYYKSPVGEIALLVYYRDPGNYVQLVMEQNAIALYEATDAKPLVSQGWKGYVWYPANIAIGDAHTLGAMVDTTAGTVTPVVDGITQGSVTIASLRGGARHYVAVRSIGNEMSFGDVQIASGLGLAAPSPSPSSAPTASATPTAKPSTALTPLPTLAPTPTPLPLPKPTPTPTPSPSPTAPAKASPSPSPSPLAILPGLP